MLIFFFLVYCYKKTVKSFRLKIFHWEKKTRKKPSRPEHLFSSFFCSSVRLKQVKSTQQLHQFRRKKNPKPESCHSQLLYIATARSLTARIGSSRALTPCQRKQEPGKCPGWTWASHSYFWSKAFGTLRILLDKLWNLWSLHTRLKDYLECLYYVSEEGDGLWLVNISKYSRILADKQVHTFCLALHIVSICSSYCFWKNLSTQQENQHEALLSVENIYIKLFLVYLIVSRHTWRQEKLAPDLKTVRLQLYISICYTLKATILMTDI